MTSFFDIQQLCIQKLDDLGATNKFDTYETDVPIGTQRPDVNYSTTPYVIIDFGNKSVQALTDRGITGMRDDLKYMSVVFEVVSNNPATSRQVADIITDAFDGYQPDPTWGEFDGHITSPPITITSAQGGEIFPPRYHRTLAYVVDVDA